MNFDDIINKSRPIAKNPMPKLKRAVQFAPFKALEGYEEEIEEQMRYIEEKREISEDAAEILNRRLSYAMSEDLKISITYFSPDIKKDGGNYVITSGKVVKLNKISHTLTLDNNLEIPASEIYDLKI